MRRSQGVATDTVDYGSQRNEVFSIPCDLKLSPFSWVEEISSQGTHLYY